MLKAVSGEITSQDLNNNFSYLDNEKLGKGEVPFYMLDKSGAAGDGVADDTAIIQQFISDMPENGTLVLGENKNYKITAEIIGEKNINIIGRGSTITATHTGHALTFQGTLKSTKTVTTNYAKGANSITLSDVSGIQPGDLLNIVSTELYDTSRSYYYKGGNVLVSYISGNTVYLSMAFPFDMTGSTITVKVYKSIVVNIDSLNIIHSGALPAGYFGISLRYAKFSKLSRVKVDNFNHNINLQKTVNCLVDRAETGRSYYTGSSESYGLSNYSGTNLKITNSSFLSGRHGVANTGQECVFGTYIENCMIGQEKDVQLQGLDAHGNTHSMTVVNSEIYNFGVTGNITFKNCMLHTGFTPYQAVGVAESFDRANYVFDNCTFVGGAIRLGASYQQATTSRKYIGSFIMKNCKTDGLSITINLTDRYGSELVGTVDKVIVENTNDVYFIFNDNINLVRLESVDTVKDVKFIEQLTSGKIKRTLLKNVGFPERYRTIALSNFDFAKMDTCFLNDLGLTSAGVLFNSTGGKVVIENTDLSGFDRGFETSGLGSLRVNDGTVPFYSTNKANITSAQQASYVAM